MMRAPASGRRPAITVLYHFMHPDDVVSARHFDGLAEGLAARGWDVTAMPSNRACHDDGRSFDLQERWHGAEFERIWRPAFRQASGRGRIANAGGMLASWCARAARSTADVVLLGTDPILSVAIAPMLKALRPSLRIAHWAHDLYPEAAIADGMIAAGGVPARALEGLVERGYRACDLVVDIGPCMRERLRAYHHGAREETLVPWAISEPWAPLLPPQNVRHALFGDARLGVLYSGNFGRAHAYEGLLALARQLRDAPIRFCFAVRGNRADELRRAVGPEDTNITFAGFCSEDELELRLASADVHAASLRDEWSGVVVPSKFFGSLAAGRPVLFDGPDSSSLARWIGEHRVGFALRPDRLAEVALSLRVLATDRLELQKLWGRCHAVYRTHFSQPRVVDAWDRALRTLL